MLGMAYDSSKHPNFRIPSDSPIYFGVDFDSAGINKAIAGTYWNPGPLSPPRPVAQLPLVPATKDDFRSPKPDPGEHFDRITTQIFGGNGQVNHINNQMRGFVLDYGKSFGSVAAHIMRYYTPEHVPVITSLARNFAVCDRWFAARRRTFAAARPASPRTAPPSGVERRRACTSHLRQAYPGRRTRGIRNLCTGLVTTHLQ